MRHWRKMTWVLILWSVLILAWAIGGASSGASKNAADCAHSTYLTVQQCLDASNAGTGLGVAFILLIGFFGFVFFGLIWLMTRPRLRTCPTCGEGVRKGVMVCPSCQHDFVAGTRTAIV